MRPTTRLAALALTATMFVATENLLAQRRTEGGGGSEGRSTPSNGSGGERSTPSASSGGRSGGETRASSGEGRRSSGTQPSTRSRDRDEPSTSTRRGENSGNSARTSTRRAEGKISSVRRGAAAARAGKTLVGVPVWVGGCWSCDYWGWYGGRWGRYHGGYWYPDYYGGGYSAREDREEEVAREEEGGQGYLDYPYARSENADETFVRRRTLSNRGFGAITAWGYSDMGSDVRAGRLSLEGAIGVIRGQIDYGRYDEPLQTRTDRMHTLRFNAGVQPRLGERAYLVAAIGARGLFVDSSDAWGPEGELGLQVFPFKPIGLNITGRIASLSWEGNDNFSVRELNTTGSLFLGRFEVQGGWHWMKIEDTPAFGGPMAGIRVWF